MTARTLHHCLARVAVLLLRVTPSNRLCSTSPTLSCQGGDRIKEAGTYFRELNDRFGGSVAGVNGLAAVYIAQGKHADAERLLEELLESTPAQPDALINLITIAEHRGADASKWLEQLREAAPEHPYLQQLALVEGTFDRLAATFAA